MPDAPKIKSLKEARMESIIRGLEMIESRGWKGWYEESLMKFASSPLGKKIFSKWDIDDYHIEHHLPMKSIFKLRPLLKDLFQKVLMECTNVGQVEDPNQLRFSGDFKGFLDSDLTSLLVTVDYISSIASNKVNKRPLHPDNFVPMETIIKDCLKGRAIEQLVRSLVSSGLLKSTTIDGHEYFHDPNFTPEEIRAHYRTRPERGEDTQNRSERDGDFIETETHFIVYSADPEGAKFVRKNKPRFGRPFVEFDLFTQERPGGGQDYSVQCSECHAALPWDVSSGNSQPEHIARALFDHAMNHLKEQGSPGTMGLTVTLRDYAQVILFKGEADREAFFRENPQYAGERDRWGHSA